MARPGKHDGIVYQRSGTKFWWMRYRDRQGERRQEPTGTPHWHEAQQKLRERLQARDQNILAVVRKGEKLTFDQWADFFLENYSKPPMRAQKTHEANVNALKHLRSSLGSLTLSEINADHIENYLRSRLKQRTRVRRRTGFFDLGPLKATTSIRNFVW